MCLGSNFVAASLKFCFFTAQAQMKFKRNILHIFRRNIKKHPRLSYPQFRSRPATKMTLPSAYLTAYNSLSCALWALLLLRTLASAPGLYAAGNLHQLYHDLLFPWLAGTQTLALIEIVHAATGLVRASPVTTAIQVIGKNLVVWTVMVAFPEIVVGGDGRGAAGVWPFVGCVVFWGVSEVVRYGYFVVLLVRGGDVMGWLKWLR
jgi:very-long-chain (3R)-3-hydroxyacyl-CoA dehydratase